LSDAAALPSGSAKILVGRQDELELIRSFLARAGGEGRALTISGEPGVGKSVLLDAAAEAATMAGIQILRAAGVEFEAGVGFSALHQLLIPLHDRFERLSPTYREALGVALGLDDGPPSDRLVVSNAVLTVLREVAAERPVLVIVDDLPWVDRASAVVLGFVARRLAGSRVGFLAASRSGEESFLDRTGLPGHELLPLKDEAAGSLVSDRFPALGPEVRRRVLAEAQGNPLALLELAAALSAPQRTSSRRLPAVLPLSRRLQYLFASRVGDLPARTRYLLLLAVLDGTGDLRTLQAAAADQREIEDLAPAEHRGLVHVNEDTGRLVFAHPLIRSAVMEVATSDQRRFAHRALAGQLADQPERQAWHLAEAALEPEEKVAELLEQSAHRILRRGDSVGAVATLLRAADLSPRPADRSRRMAAAAYLGADVTGDLRSVSRLLEDARRADPQLGGSLQAALAAAYALLNGDGDVDTAHRLVTGAIETWAAPADTDETVLIEALQTLLYVCLWALRPGLWVPFYMALARLAQRIPATLLLEVQTIADPVRTAGPALAQLDAAITSLRDEVDVVRIDRITRAATYVDRIPGCRQTLWRVVRDGREGGAVTAAIFAMMNLCVDGFFTGRWDESEELAGEGLALCEAHGYRLLAWPFRLGSALVAAGRGDYERTRTLTDEMMIWAVPRRIRGVQMFAWHARTIAALGQGDYETAYQHASAISPAGTFASHVAYALWVPMDLVEAAVRGGRYAEAAAHATAMREADIAAISPRLALVTAGSAAMAVRDDHDDAWFEQALAVPGASRWPFDFARVQLAYGERLRRARATTKARTHLAAALRTFEGLRAEPWAARAGAELRAAGQATARIGGHIPAPGSLTPQEREVALLAAAGMSNKQIAERLGISHRTVSAHLYQVFPKLGITSRAALRDALASRPEEQRRRRT
jgi:DNA-binding CsgD family transcriptional regulator